MIAGVAGKGARGLFPLSEWEATEKAVNKARAGIILAVCVEKSFFFLTDVRRKWSMC